MKYQDLSQFKIPAGFRGRNALVVQLWWMVDAVFFKTSPQILYGWRRFLLRCFGAKIGKNVIIRPSAQITYPWKVSIGDYSWIGDQVVLYSLGTISIGKHAVVSQMSYLCTGSHRHDQIAFDITAQSIVIEDEVWISSDVFIAPNVTVGRGAVVGARSMVLKSIEGAYIYAGNPLSKIRERLSDNKL